MDIDLEKEKVRYAHKFEMRRLIIEKAILGGIVIAVGLLANAYFENYRNKLEQDRVQVFEEYRNKLQQDRFLLERKLEAVNALREAFSHMHETFMLYTDIDEHHPLPKDYRSKYNKTIDDFVHAGNKWSILVSEEYLNKAENLVWIYQGFYVRNVAECAEYRSFAVDLHHYFEAACRVELGVVGKSRKAPFPLDELTWQQSESLGSDVVLDVQYEKWKEWGKTNPRSSDTNANSTIK